jgi:hypothetical protein
MERFSLPALSKESVSMTSCKWFPRSSVNRVARSQALPRLEHLAQSLSSTTGTGASGTVGGSVNGVLHDQVKMFKVTGDKATWKRFKLRTEQKVNRQVKGL